jgi:hypothetical protein
VDQRAGAGSARAQTATSFLLLTVAVVAVVGALLAGESLGTGGRVLVGAGGAWGLVIGGSALWQALHRRPRRGRHRRS